MTFLITGATGFIGRALVERLLATGHNVNYAGRRRSQTMDSRAAFHCWEQGQEPPVETMPDLDVVVHLAGEPIAQRWSPEIKRRIFESRVEGTRLLVQALGRADRKPSVLISASAVGFYGDRGSEVLTEDSSPGQGFLAQACMAWERESHRAEEMGIRVVNPRISVVMGRDGGALPKMAAPFRVGLGGQLGDGRQYTPWIHLQDLVSLFLFAAEKTEITGPINASTPEPITNREFTKALAHALNRPALFSVPKFALQLLLGELAGSILVSQRVVPAAAMDGGFRFEYPEIQNALTQLLQA